MGELRGSVSRRLHRVATFTLLLLASSAVPVFAGPSEPVQAGPADTIPIEPSEPGGGPDAEDVRKGIEEAEAEETARERWLESPEAIRQREESHYAYADLGAAEAQGLLLATFTEQLAKLNIDPARWLSDGKIEQPLGESVAAVSKEGDTSLLDAGNLPVRVVNEEGDLRKVDLSLEATSEGFKPVNPLAEVKIPDAADEPIELGKRGIAVSAIGADASREAQLLGDKNVFYSEAQGPGADTDRIVSPTSGGVEIFDLLRTADSPETLRYEIELPEGAELRSDGNRGAQAVKGDEILAWIPFPVAFDAQGTQVPVELEIEGHTIALHIEHREADVAHPILLDPHVHILEESVGYNWFNGGPTLGLDSGVWSFERNAGNNWTGGSRWCIYHCFGQSPHRGLYVFMPGGAHWGEEFGHWKYPAPTSTSYLVNAWIIPFWRWDHNCGGKGKYAQPHDYVGMWNNNTNWWKQPVRIDHAIDDGSVDLQHAGDALIFGLGTGPGSTTPCHRDLAAGGVAVWLDDSQSPTLHSVTNNASGWVDGDFTITPNADDAGLGLQQFKITPDDDDVFSHSLDCNGLSYDRCPTVVNWPITVNAGTFEEGQRNAQITAYDVTEKNSSPQQFQTKVDRTPPKVILNGQLAVETEEVGGEEQPAGTGDKLSLPVYHLKIEATDEGDQGTADAKKRSGVKDIKVFLDGDERVVAWEPNPNPCDSCSMTVTYPLKLSGLTSGKHELRVDTFDHLNHKRERKIEFEYFPATGMKDEYVMHYFPLPDGQGDEAEELHPSRPELAVNVMNGNLVYREQDVDVESYGVDLEVERYYNSMLPEDENTEWGDGWTLGQTPKLEPEPSQGAPSEALMVSTSAAFRKPVTLPTVNGQSKFDAQLQATITKEAGGGYEVADESGETDNAMAFDQNGRVKELRTDGSATVDYSYEGGELAEIAVDDPATAAYPSGEPFKGPDPVLTYAAAFGSYGTGNGQFDRPGEIAIAPNGDIWITDTYNHRIQHFDSNGNYIGKFGSNGTGNGQFNRPRGIEFDSEGNFWVLDSLNNRLQKFNDKGEYLTKWGVSGTSNGKLKTPKGFTIDSEGNFWIADTLNARIQKFSPNGTFLKVAGTSGPGDLAEPLGISTSPAGEVFVADWTQNRVVVFDSEGEYERAFGSEGEDDGEFGHPVEVDIDTQGNVWIGDELNHRVQQFDLQGNYVAQFGTEGDDDGEMDPISPMGITTDAKGSIWLTDTGNDRIQLWVLDDYRPTYGDSFGSGGTGNGQLDHPGDLAVAPNSDIWVADTYNNRVQHFDPEGNYISKFGFTGTGNGQFERPRAIEFDAAGNIWVLDSLNERLQKFNQAGEYLTKWGSYGSSNGKLDTPKGLAIDDEGNFWVADTTNDRIQKFTPNGTFLKVTGTSGPGDLSDPVSIDVSPEGEVFVVDRVQNRVVVFDSEGEYERAFGTEGGGNGELDLPLAIDVDSQGNVWVGDEMNKRVQQFDIQGNYITQFGTEGSGDGEMDPISPMGITTGAKGSIWLTDSGNNRVQRWEAPQAPPAEEELLADDPEVQVEVANDLVMSVVGDEAGEHTYEHDGDLLTAHEGPLGEISYEYDGDRMTEVTLPNETSASIAYFSDGRVKSVTVDPAGSDPAKTTEFEYTDEPRRTVVYLPDDPHITYDVGEDGSVLKWWNAKVPPIFDDVSGTLYAARETANPIAVEDYNLKIKAYSEFGIESIQVIANGDQILTEKDFPQIEGGGIEHIEAEDEWVTYTGSHSPGILNLEIIATDTLKQTASKKFWVNMPYTPPLAPGEPAEPIFEDVLQFREEHGLDLDLDPIKDEKALNDRVYNTINDWWEGDPVARASMDRWGAPLRPAEVAELEYRLAYWHQAVTEIPAWAEANASGTFAGYYLDERAGGLMRIGFTSNQAGNISSLKSGVSLPGKDRMVPFTAQPGHSLASLRNLASQVSAAGASNSAAKIYRVGVASESNEIRVGSSDVAVATLFLQNQFGAGAPISIYEAGPVAAAAGRERITGKMLGGERIFVKEPSEFESECTTGFGAFEYATKPGGGSKVLRLFALTAAHCGALNSSVIRARPPYEKDDRVRAGFMRRHGYDQHQTSIRPLDVAAVKLEGGIEPRRVYISGDSPHLAIRGWGVVGPGTRLCHSGATTNDVQCGPITMQEPEEYIQCELIPQSEYCIPGTEVPLRQWCFDAPIQGGDSGGPVWIEGTNTASGVNSSGGGRTCAAAIAFDERFPDMASVFSDPSMGPLGGLTTTLSGE